MSFFENLPNRSRRPHVSSSKLLYTNTVTPEYTHHFRRIMDSGTEYEAIDCVTYGSRGPDKTFFPQLLESLDLMFTAGRPLFYLSMEGYGLGSGAAGSLFRALEKNPAGCIWLNLKKNRIGVNALKDLDKVFKDSSSGGKLSGLSLSDNGGINERIATYIANIIRKDCLRYLDLSKSQICEPAITKILADSLKSARGLEILDLSYNWQMNISFLADILPDLCSQGIPCLSHLNLESVYLKDEGCKHLLTVLCNSTMALRTLTLKDINISAIGAAILAEGLYRNGTLTELVLSGNPIGDTGVTSIARAILPNTYRGESPLRKLYLENCDIGDFGAMAMAYCIRANCQLSVLNMRKNRIHNRGFLDLLSSIAHNPNIKTILLTDNLADDYSGCAMRTVHYAMYYNTSLTNFFVSSQDERIVQVCNMMNRYTERNRINKQKRKMSLCSLIVLRMAQSEAAHNQFRRYFR